MHIYEVGQLGEKRQLLSEILGFMAYFLLQKAFFGSPRGRHQRGGADGAGALAAAPASGDAVRPWVPRAGAVPAPLWLSPSLLAVPGAGGGLGVTESPRAVWRGMAGVEQGVTNARCGAGRRGLRE